MIYSDRIYEVHDTYTSQASNILSTWPVSHVRTTTRINSARPTGKTSMPNATTCNESTSPTGKIIGNVTAIQTTSIRAGMPCQPYINCLTTSQSSKIGRSTSTTETTPLSSITCTPFTAGSVPKLIALQFLDEFCDNRGLDFT